MSGSVLRRLGKLEGLMHPTEGTDLAMLVEDGRRRAHSMTPAELRAAGAARLAEMQTRHAERPLRGLELSMMLGVERAQASGAAA